MKHSEKELESCLREKIHPETKTIDITIDGEYLHENNELLEKVDESLAYKKTHKPQREENKYNGCDNHNTDTDECCIGHKDDKCFDVEKINNEHTSKYPYGKMPKEFIDVFNTCKNIEQVTVNPSNTNGWDEFCKINQELLPNEKLLKEWKEYKKQVNDFIEKHPKLPKLIVNAMMLDEYPEEKKVDNRPWEVQEFEKITKQMFDTYQKKNADYGNSFDDLFDEFGMTSALLRIKDKYNRLKSITEKNKIEVKNESVEDTLIDMANYAILTVIKLRRNKQ